MYLILWLLCKLDKASVLDLHIIGQIHFDVGQPQIRSYLNVLCILCSISLNAEKFWCLIFLCVLVFRCIDNCRAKVSPVRQLTLTVVCANRPCISLATFSWTIHTITSNRQGKFIWSEFNNTSLIRTSVNTTQFHLPRLDTLTNVKEGQKFQVQATATDHNGILQEQALYTFNVNAPPKLVRNSEETGCHVNPTEGSAIITDFYISCLVGMIKIFHCAMLSSTNSASVRLSFKTEALATWRVNSP